MENNFRDSKTWNWQKQPRHFQRTLFAHPSTATILPGRMSHHQCHLRPTGKLEPKVTSCKWFLLAGEQTLGGMFTKLLLYRFALLTSPLVICRWILVLCNFALPASSTNSRVFRFPLSLGPMHIVSKSLFFTTWPYVLLERISVISNSPCAPCWRIFIHQYFVN